MNSPGNITLGSNTVRIENGRIVIELEELAREIKSNKVNFATSSNTVDGDGILACC